MAVSLSPHGKTEISVAGSTMTILTRGPWNIEYFSGLHRDISAVIKKNSLTNFTVLLVPYGEAVCVHDALDYHINFLRQGTTKAVAVNLSFCDTPFCTESMCRTVYEGAKIEHEFFYDSEQAMLWLKSKSS